MRLPTIVILERHLDTNARRAIQHLIPLLSKHGYDALCLEAPATHTEKQIKNLYKTTINTSLKHLQDALTALERHKINCAMDNLINMDYSILAEFLKNYVSSKRFNELALMFKAIPANKIMNEIVNDLQSYNISLHGVDINNLLEKCDFLAAGLENHILNIDQQMSQRDQVITDNTLQIREKHNGTILIVGRDHYDGIVSRLQTKKCSGDFIFVYPKASHYLDSSYVEELTLNNHKNSICIRTVIIDHPTDIETLNATIVQNIYQKIYTEILEKLHCEQTLTKVLSGEASIKPILSFSKLGGSKKTTPSPICSIEQSIEQADELLYKIKNGFSSR